jgi:putative acetyltransferase
MLSIRTEREDDYQAVRQVIELAFGQPNEANLVKALRVAASPLISLVAENEGGIVGHILFSPVSVESEDGVFIAMGLAPLAVRPEHQRRGIGGKLIQAGLRACHDLGHDLIFVLGHSDYYPRFGFKTAKTLGFTCEYPVPDEVFMVAELTPQAAGGRRGLVKYHPTFSEF